MNEKEMGIGVSVLEPTIVIGPAPEDPELDDEFPEGEEGEV